MATLIDDNGRAYYFQVHDMQHERRPMWESYEHDHYPYHNPHHEIVIIRGLLDRSHEPELYQTDNINNTASWDKTQELESFIEERDKKIEEITKKYEELKLKYDKEVNKKVDCGGKTRWKLLEVGE